MPKFEIEAGGRRFEVEAPSHEEALAAVDGGGSQPKSFGLGDTWPARMGKAIWGGITLPRDVYQGKVDPLSDEGIGRTAELAGLGTPMSTAIRAGERAIPGVAKSLKQGGVAPTAKELRAAGAADYKAVQGMDVTYGADAVKGMAQQLQAGLEKRIVPEQAPLTFKQLGRLQNPGEGSLATFENLKSARETFQSIAGDFTAQPRDRMAAVEAIRAIDGFIEKPPASGVVAGPATGTGVAPFDPSAPVSRYQDALRAGELYKRGRGNFDASFRSNELTGELTPAYTDVLNKAELQAAIANSGKNIDNKLRQRVGAILQSPKELRGWSPDEIAAMERLAFGSNFKNLARDVGSTFGGGGGLGLLAGMSSGAAAGAGGGAVAGGPLGAVLGGAVGAAAAPAVGLSARRLASSLSRKELKRLDEQARKRSPLFQERTSMVPTDFVRRDALVRALLAEQLSQQ